MEEADCLGALSVCEQSRGLEAAVFEVGIWILGSAALSSVSSRNCPCPTQADVSCTLFPQLPVLKAPYHAPSYTKPSQINSVTLGLLPSSPFM